MLLLKAVKNALTSVFCPVSELLHLASKSTAKIRTIPIREYKKGLVFITPIYGVLH
jgi:hypothetical protein